MMPWISNARMYAVTPGVEAAWQQLIDHVAQDAGVALTYEPYAAPQPLEVLWRRSDLGCVFMCGYPIALTLADVQPIAAPIPEAAWAGGRALYRSDLVVRADSAFRTLEDTFGGTLGWTVEHSHSGFNAPRHHLLARRPAGGGHLYERSVGSLITARGVLDAVIDGADRHRSARRLLARSDPATSARPRGADPGPRLDRPRALAGFRGVPRCARRPGVGLEGQLCRSLGGVPGSRPSRKRSA